MRRVMPAAAATSSMEVAANPSWTKAEAAASRMAARRSGRARSCRVAVFAGAGMPLQVYTDAFTVWDMTTAVQTEWTERELLASEEVVEPLFAGGVRCHGGFDSEGRYLSPRTRNRFPAIAAWQAQRARDFGTPLLDVPLSSWPESYPNVAQAAFLISAGVPQPVISTLTRIGTVEGFGAMLRYSEI